MSTIEPPLVWAVGTELGTGPVLVQYPADVDLPEGWRIVTSEEAARIRSAPTEQDTP